MADIHPTARQFKELVQDRVRGAMLCQYGRQFPGLSLGDVGVTFPYRLMIFQDRSSWKRFVMHLRVLEHRLQVEMFPERSLDFGFFSLMRTSSAVTLGHQAAAVQSCVNHAVSLLPVEVNDLWATPPNYQSRVVRL